MHSLLCTRSTLYFSHCVTIFIHNILLLFFIPDYAHSKPTSNESVCPPFSMAPSLRSNLKCDFMWNHEESDIISAGHNLTIRDDTKETHGVWSFSPHCYVRGRRCSDSVTEKVIVSCPRLG